ncbi:hypothetical protein FRB94_007874 [Tulasnella sp. JGI-2019a]|nr:hypothetical protein FRB94_007874 [Tulasnella sp. JGI-2019a]
MSAGWFLILRRYYLKAFQSPHEIQILGNTSILTNYPGSHFANLRLYTAAYRRTKSCTT